MNNPTPPPAPDPVATANAQAASNRSTAITQQGLNSTNQVTPYGNLTYTQSGTWADGTPHYTATTTLSPEEQGLYDQYLSSQQKMGSIGGQQLDKVAGILNTPFDLNTAATNDQWDLYRKTLDPQWEAKQSAFDAKLANQGITPGSEAYTNASRDFGMNRDNAYNSALLASRGQAVQEALANRNQPLNDITALMSGSQVQSPNFVGTPQTQVAPTDVIGANRLSSDVAQNNYNQQIGQNNAMYGAIGSMAGTALGGWASGGFRPPRFA